MVDDGVAIASLLVSFDRLDCLDVGSGKVSIWACMRLWVWSLQPMDSMVTLVACEGDDALAELIANLLCLGGGDLRVTCFRCH